MYPLTTLLFLICITAIAQPPAKQTGRIYLSRDQGQNWERADEGFPEDAVNAWVDNDGVIIAGTNNHGIFISSDRGKSWYSSNRGLPRDTRITSLISYKTLLLAGTYRDGILLSHDGGETWNTSNSGLKNLTIRCFFSLGPHLLVGTNDGMYISDDAGKSWTAEKNGVQVNAFSMGNHQLLAATNQGVLASKDYGNTWNWVFKEGAIYTLASEGKEVYLMDFFGTVYQFTTADFVWVKVDMYLPLQATFRLTPSSSKFLTVAWKRAFTNLNSVQHVLHTNGLPEDTAFIELLDTPFGLLAAAVLPKKVE